MAARTRIIKTPVVIWHALLELFGIEIGTEFIDEFIAHPTVEDPSVAACNVVEESVLMLVDVEETVTELHLKTK